MSLDTYRKKLVRSCRRFSCPECNELVLPVDYEKHCTKVHHFNSKLGCVWCKKRTWFPGKKAGNANHLFVCFLKFINCQFQNCSQIEGKDVYGKAEKEPIPQETPTYKLLNLKHKYPQKTLFDFPSLPTKEYDVVWPLNVDPPPVDFQDDNLNLAASYIIKYLESRETHEWFQAMVKAVSFDSFLHAMDLDGGISRTLEFSCWCNGGPYIEPRHRQHRHLIVTSPIDHFEKHVWSKVVVDKRDKPNRNFACKRLKPIKSPLHLVNMMGYLSHRKSRCQFTTMENPSTPVSMHHFYLYRTLPIAFKLPLSLLWKNGIMQLLYMKKFQNTSISRVMKHPIVFDKQWKQKIKHFYNLERGLVIPVSKRFLPTNQVTKHYLHLMGDEKLYFKSCSDNERMDQDMWLQKQVDGGNSFYEAVEQEFWVPRPRDQHVLTIVLPIVYELAAFKEQHKKEIGELRHQNKLQDDKINHLYKENDKLKLDIQQIKTPNDYLSEENTKLKLENKRLKDKINHLHEALCLVTRPVK